MRPRDPDTYADELPDPEPDDTLILATVAGLAVLFVVAVVMGWPR